MIKIFAITFVLLTILTSCTKNIQSSETSTYYFIRHAEKDRSDVSNDNPHLIEKGKQRAEHWNDVFKNINFDAVYSTNYHRTLETAIPTSVKNNVEITIYDFKNLDIDKYLDDTKGKSVLVVGHSNTTPEFVNNLIGKEKYKDINDSNNANLFIVTVCGDIISDTLLLVE